MHPVLLAAAALAATAPRISAPATGGAPAKGTLRVAGAAATQALWQRWFLEYAKAHPGGPSGFSFEAAGPAESVRRVSAGEAAVASTTAPLAEAQAALAPTLVNLPIAASGVAVVYNLLIAGDLRLTPELVVALFSGRITRWKDPQIAAANPGVLFPDLPVTVIVQAEDTGDAATFRDYLGHLSGPAHASFVGTVASDPRALVTAVKGRDGTLAFVDAALARSSDLYAASLRNRAGYFVQPSMRSISHAAVGGRLRDDFRASIVDGRGVETYPIASFTHAVVDLRGIDSGRSRAVRDFLRWTLHEGQKLTPALGYAPLPGLLARTVDARLAANGSAER